MWTNYIQIANEEHLGDTTYELLNDKGCFNLGDFENKCLE
jgi:hypothetical protein